MKDGEIKMVFYDYEAYRIVYECKHIVEQLAKVKLVFPEEEKE
jgi:hypothetical protein